MKPFRISYLVVAFIFLSSVGFADELPIAAFSQVTAGIYRGARPGDKGLQYLNALNVKTVIDLQGGDLIKFDPSLNDWFEVGETPESIAQEKAQAELLHMAFYNKPLSSFDDVSRTEDQEIEAALSIMHDPASQPVFVHCEHGKDRTGLLVALYEVRYLGYSIAQAHKEWESSGHTDAVQIATHELDEYFRKKSRKLLLERKNQ